MSDAFNLSCHCGAVEGVVMLSDGLSTARRCDCSFCKRRTLAAVTAPFPDGVKITKGADNLARYQWGTGTAQHYFCKTCGIYTHHRRRSNPNEFGVNAGCLEGVNPRNLEPIAWSDGVNHPADRQ